MEAIDEHADEIIVGGLFGAACGLHVSLIHFGFIPKSRNSLGGRIRSFEIRTDPDMYTLTLDFYAWKGNKYSVCGGLVLDYLRSTATNNAVDKNVRFNPQVVSAEWNSHDRSWTINTENNLVENRAKQDGNCCAMVVCFSDIEKQTAVADYCKLFSGSCYFATGIHPDNIDRTNKKSHEEWMEKVEELAKRAECIGILSGKSLIQNVLS